MSNAFPIVYWTNVVNDYLIAEGRHHQPVCGDGCAVGRPGTASTMIRWRFNSALTAAGAGGGGIVYVPGRQVSFDQHAGQCPAESNCAELEMRHGTWPGADGIAKGTCSNHMAGREPPTAR